MYLRFQFCTHHSVCILHFLKKVKFVVPYCAHSLFTLTYTQTGAAATPPVHGSFAAPLLMLNIEKICYSFSYFNNLTTPVVTGNSKSLCGWLKQIPSKPSFQISPSPVPIPQSFPLVYWSVWLLLREPISQRCARTNRHSRQSTELLC